MFCNVACQEQSTWTAMDNQKMEGDFNSMLTPPSFLYLIPVSVFVLPLLVAPVVAAWGGGGSSLLRLQVLQRRVHILRVFLAGLVFLVLEIWRGIAFCAAACLTWRNQNNSINDTNYHQSTKYKLLMLLSSKAKLTLFIHVIWYTTECTNGL